MEFQLRLFMYPFSTMKVAIFFVLVLCILSAGMSSVYSQRLSERIDQTLCQRTCRLFTRVHRRGCCELYNSCCATVWRFETGWKNKRNVKASDDAQRKKNETDSRIYSFSSCLPLILWNYYEVLANYYCKNEICC